MLKCYDKPPATSRKALLNHTQLAIPLLAGMGLSTLLTNSALRENQAQQELVFMMGERQVEFNYINQKSPTSGV